MKDLKVLWVPVGYSYKAIILLFKNSLLFYLKVIPSDL